MRARLQQFMMGRYGADQLAGLQLALWLICFFLSVFLKGAVSTVFDVIAIFFMIWYIYRVMSRDTYRRSLENQKFLNMTAGIRKTFTRQKNHMEQRRYYHLYKCPTCRQIVRVPKGKGRISITCPKCRTEFIKNS